MLTPLYNFSTMMMTTTKTDRGEEGEGKRIFLLPSTRSGDRSSFHPHYHHPQNVALPNHRNEHMKMEDTKRRKNAMPWFLSLVLLSFLLFHLPSLNSFQGSSLSERFLLSYESGSATWSFLLPPPVQHETYAALSLDSSTTTLTTSLQQQGSTTLRGNSRSQLPGTTSDVSPRTSRTITTPRSGSRRNSTGKESLPREDGQQVHVLYGIMGTSLIEPWLVSLKSVLLNAPLDDGYSLHIHVMANHEATVALEQALLYSNATNKIVGSFWRNPIHMTIYNVEALHPQWGEFLESKLSLFYDNSNTTTIPNASIGENSATAAATTAETSAVNASTAAGATNGVSRSPPKRILQSRQPPIQLDGRVTLGGYYRLLAYQLLLLPQQQPKESVRMASTSQPQNQTNNSSVVKRTTDVFRLPSDNNINNNIDDSTIGPVLYMDTDVVVMANLQELWRHVNHTLLMQVAAHLPWGEPRRSTCSGVMILNMPLFAQQFFDCVQQIPNLGGSAGDQTLIALVAQAFPNRTGILPSQWGDRNLGHGWRRSPHELMEQSQNSMAKSSRGGGTTSSDGYGEAGAGLLHFQGGAGRANGQHYFTNGLDQYCERTRQCQGNPHRQALVRQSWGLADYYIRLDWSWVLYFGQSLIRQSATDVTGSRRGFPLTLHIRNFVLENNPN